MKLKKILGLGLAAALALSLFACGGGESATSEPPADDDAAASTPADENTAAPEGNEPSGDAILVGFAQVGHESDWRTASTKSAQDVFSAANGYELSFVDCDNDPAAQLEAVRSFIQQGMDYIIIDPIQATGWDTVLTECDEAGIPVIIIDRTVDDSDKYVAWVGSDFKVEGLACGEWLKAYAADKGITEINALVIEGSVGASATIGRTDGFKEIADREGWNILASQSGDFTEAGITYGVGGDVILVSFDANKPYVQMVCDGKINANFECNPMAAPTVDEIIKALEAGETPESEVYVAEHWFAAEDNVKTITVNGEEQEVIHATQDVVDGRPY